MKLAIISDVHFGVNYGRRAFIEYQREFFDGFWDVIDKRKITKILFLGDFFHSRKMVNFDTLELARDCWFTPAKKRNVSVFMLIGNHDVFYKNTNRLNSLDLLCENAENIKVIQTPQTFKIGKVNYCFLPWINIENRDECLKELQTTKASIVLSHLELQLEDNQHIKGQIDLKDLERFSHVFSGHFHFPTIKNLTGCVLRYLGSPYEMTWNDYGVKERGWYVFDDVTKETELIKNDRYIHHYHTLGNEIEWIEPFHCLRVYVPAKMSATEYELAMVDLKKKEIMKVQTIAEQKEEEQVEIKADGDELDVLQMVLKYAENNKGGLDGDKMNAIIRGLWEGLHE